MQWPCFGEGRRKARQAVAEARALGKPPPVPWYHWTSFAGGICGSVRMSLVLILAP